MTIKKLARNPVLALSIACAIPLFAAPASADVIAEGRGCLGTLDATVLDLLQDDCRLIEYRRRLIGSSAALECTVLNEDGDSVLIDVEIQDSVIPFCATFTISK